MALAEYGNALNIDTDGSGNPILVDPQSGDVIAIYDRASGAWQVTEIEATTGDFGSVNTELLNGVVVKHPEDDFQERLNTAVDEGKTLYITSGIHTLSQQIKHDASGGTRVEVLIHMDDGATIVNDGSVSNPFHFEHLSKFVLKGGTYDGNHSNRGDVLAAGSEWEVWDVRDEGVKIKNHDVIDNAGWAFDLNAVEDVDISGVHVDTDENDAAADGIHLRSTSGVVQNVSISNCVIRSQDDAVALTHNSDHVFRNVEVSNVVTEPQNHNGLKVLIEDTAASGAEYRNIRFSGVVTPINSQSQAVVVRNDKDSQTRFYDIDIDVTADGINEPGVLVENAEGVRVSGDIQSRIQAVDFTDVTDFTIDASAQSEANAAIDLRDCEDGHIQTTAKTAVDVGVVKLAGCSDVTLEPHAEGPGTSTSTSAGVELNSCTDCKVKNGTVEGCDKGVYGLSSYGGECKPNLVSGMSVKGGSNGVETINDCGAWIVTANDLRRVGTATSLSTTAGANITANNLS